MITVLRSGPLNTVQDRGRPGRMHLGVACAGAMDPEALRLGGRLLRNDEDAAGVEVAAFPFAIRFEARLAFAVTGAAGGVTLSSRRLPPDCAFVAREGEVLEITPDGRGVFAYVGVEGGLDTPVTLGSRSTDLKSGFGGLAGRALAAGDRLAVAESERPSGIPARGLGIVRDVAPDDDAPTPVRFIPAAEWMAVGAETRARFTSETWTVSREVNRQGYRLTGPTLDPSQLPQLLSHGVAPGVIQLPPAGLPIVQMVEANTCGGYPKLGVVLAADLGRLAQTRSGRGVTFTPVDHAQARRIAADHARRRHALTLALDLMRDPAA